jgi:hypothetical protein
MFLRQVKSRNLFEQMNHGAATLAALDVKSQSLRCAGKLDMALPSPGEVGWARRVWFTRTHQEYRAELHRRQGLNRGAGRVRPVVRRCTCGTPPELGAQAPS